MSKLTIFPNEPNHEQDKQNAEIQTALLSINSWANRINQELADIITTPGADGAIGATGPAGPSGVAGPAGVVSGTYPITYDSGTQTVAIAPYYLPQSGGVMSGNIATSVSGTNLIGASGVPFSGVWANEGHFKNLYGFSPITVNDDLIPVTSGTKNLGSAALPWSGIYVNQINGVTVPRIVFSEVPTGDVDGVNNQYRLAGQALNNDILLFKNGIAQTPTTDYLFSTSTITMNTPPPVNSHMLAHYQYNTPTLPLAWDANVIGAWFLKTNSTDSTTYGRNLTNQGNPETFTTLAGKACPTVFSTRGGGYVSPILTQLSGLSTCTVEFEIYHHSNDTREIGITNDTGFWSMQMTSNTSANINYSNVYISSATTPGLDTWFHVAMVKSATRQKFYINYVLVADIAATFTLGPNPILWVGKDWYDLSNIDCSIRNVVVSNIARTTFPTTQV